MQTDDQCKLSLSIGSIKLRSQSNTLNTFCQLFIKGGILPQKLIPCEYYFKIGKKA